MKYLRFLSLLSGAVLCLVGLTCVTPARSAPLAQSTDLPACKVALRIVTSPSYITAHLGEIPDADKLNETQQIEFVEKVFRESIAKNDDQELFCSNTVKDNLRYSEATHLPAACTEFLPLLKKSFEDKVAYKTDVAKQVQGKMDEALTEMLVLGESEPAQLIARCEVGLEVMRVDLKDKHLERRYPLPATCEALFADMEKTLILPAQLETLRRQRVIFFLENKNTPEKLEMLCQQISR